MTAHEMRIKMEEDYIRWELKRLQAEMAADTGPLNDTIREKPTFERKREWEHGEQGKAKECVRYSKKIYTPPEAVPGTCRGWDCDNTEYYSKGAVVREKGTKEIVDREKSSD